MAGYVMIGALAAFGALCVLWLLCGLLLPRPRGGRLVYFASETNEELVLRRYFWLRDLGFLRCELVLVDSRIPPRRQSKITEKCNSVRFYTRAQWIEQEKENLG